MKEKTAEEIAFEEGKKAALRELKNKVTSGVEPGKKVAIAVLTPTLGSIHMLWHLAQNQIIAPMNWACAKIGLIDKKGGEVGEVRNKLVQMMLDSQEATPDVNLSHVFWVDDDVVINRACLLKLLTWDRDVAAGVYFGKVEVPQPLIFDGGGSGYCKYTPAETHDGLPGESIEKWGYSQGLSLVRLGVYKRMKEELDIGVDKYGNTAWYKQPDFGVNERGQLSLGGTEDFWFFDNLSKLGIRPLVDLSSFCFGYHINSRTGEGFPKRQWEQYERGEPVIWTMPDGKEVIWQ